MFILYAIVAGVVAGLALGGRLEGLAAVRLRWVPLAIGGLAVQVLLFTDAGWSIAGPLAPAVYVASTAAVLVVVLANLRVPGVALVAAGAALNLAAILANGGSMPADPAALASLGLTAGGATNSVVLENPALRPLTDVFVLPAWLPLANVFSIGDVLIGLGIAIAIAASMRATRTEAAVTTATGSEPGGMEPAGTQATAMEAAGSASGGAGARPTPATAAGTEAHGTPTAGTQTSGAEEAVR